MATDLQEPAGSAGSSLFGAIPSLLDALYASGSERCNTIDATLVRFGYPPLRLAADRGIRIAVLAHQRYTDASPALARLGIDVDTWPTPPAGLFVVEERTVYLRSRSPMTIAHEFAHALDCALGGGLYRSSADLELRALYARARVFVTPYAASGLDEYWAEATRAFFECNDERSHWPRATRARLCAIQPDLYAHVERIFTHEIPRLTGVAA